FFNSNGNVAEYFPIETFLDLTRGNELAFGTGERRVVHAENHCDRWFINGNRGQRLRIVGRRDGFTDVDCFDSGERHDFAYFGILRRLTLQTLEHVKFFDSSPRHRSVPAGNRNLLVSGNLSGKYSPDRQTPDVLVVVDIRDQQLQRVVTERARRRNRLDNLIE